METTVNSVAIVLGVLQILSILLGGLRFYTKIKVDFATMEGKISTEVAKIEGRIEKIEAQYVPNGGSSMRDAVNRIESKIAKLEGRFEQHIDENE